MILKLYYRTILFISYITFYTFYTYHIYIKSTDNINLKFILYAVHIIIISSDGIIICDYEKIRIFNSLLLRRIALTESNQSINKKHRIFKLLNN